MQVPVRSNSSFHEFMDRALGPYNALRSAQERTDDKLAEIHEGMVEDWKVVDWDSLVPDWISLTKA